MVPISWVGLEWYLTALLMRICRVCHQLGGLGMAAASLLMRIYRLCHELGGLGLAPDSDAAAIPSPPN
jgi:hypothetical protein